MNQPPSCPSMRPTLKPETVILHGRRLRLSDTQARLLTILLARSGRVVPDTELPMRGLALRLCIARIRQVITPHGFTIYRDRGTGYVLAPAAGTLMTAPSTGAATDFGDIFGHQVQGVETAAVLLVDRERVVVCTPMQYRIAAQLLRSPGTPVAFAHFRPLSRHALAKHISAIRRKIAPLGLTIHCLDTHGYTLQEPSETHDAPAAEACSLSGAEPKKER